MKRSLVFHPFLIALFPVISILAENTGELEYAPLIPAAVACLAMVLVVLCICQILLRDMLRTGLVVSGFLIFFFSPFHVFTGLANWLADYSGEEWHLSIGPFLMVWILAVSGYIYFFAKKATGLKQLNTILNVVSLCLISGPVLTTAVVKFSEKIDWSGIHQQQQMEPLVAAVAPKSQLPDIYYIIMDRYAGSETLKTTYGFDNKEFLTYLRAKGFYVAADSAANYPSTTQSLASSLNFQYLNYVGKFVDPESNSWIPLQRLLQDHKVGQFLKNMGYRYIHLGSWWEPTRKNKLADENVYFVPFPESFYTLYGTTMLYPISSALRMLDLRYEHWRGHRRQFENLLKTVEVKGPKFVFAHFLLPHSPYVFARNGDYVPFDHASKQGLEAAYIDQLISTNRLLQGTLDSLLSQSKQPPIIILQADEGPWPHRYELDQNKFDWRLATDTEIKQKMKILNSYYVPGTDSRALYPTISPVNTFRVIFNLYFKTNLPLLPDESFIYQEQRHPHNLSDISSRLRRN